VSVPIGGPPEPGQCVTAMTDPWKADPQPGFASGQITDFPVALFAECDGPVVGEVGYVDPNAAPPKRIIDNDYQTLVGQCALDSIAYVGSIPPVVARPGGQPSILWQPSLSFRYTTVGPTAVQRAAGQKWSACVVGASDAKPYVGRLRQALATGVLPPVFGSCWLTSGLAETDQVPCSQPHRYEVLGSTDTSPEPIRAADLQRAYTVYAARALRTNDPTRHGAVRVEIVDFDESAAVIPAADAQIQGGYVVCVVAAQGDERFTSTLVGIGERPLPLA